MPGPPGPSGKGQPFPYVIYIARSAACEMEGGGGVGWWKEYVGKVIPPETLQYNSCMHAFHISILLIF